MEFLYQTSIAVSTKTVDFTFFSAMDSRVIIISMIPVLVVGTKGTFCGDHRKDVLKDSIKESICVQNSLEILNWMNCSEIQSANLKYLTRLEIDLIITHQNGPT